MEKSTKVRFLSGLVAFVMSGSISFTTLPEVYAEGININYSTEQENDIPKAKPGTFIEVPLEIDGEEFDLYAVKEGDNLSKISEKYVAHYGTKAKTGKKWGVTTKYWPVWAYLNGYPRVAHEGDLLLVYDDINKTDETRTKLGKTGWLSRYINANDVYGKQKLTRKIHLNVMDVLESQYGEEICRDPDFVAKVLKKMRIRQDPYTLIDLGTYYKMLSRFPSFTELGYGELEPVTRGR